jgi:4-carboxymuconolactone decarboxylase
MTEPANPFAAMMKMGQDWARAMNPALESFNAQGLRKVHPDHARDVMEMFMGKTAKPGGWTRGRGC